MTKVVDAFVLDGGQHVGGDVGIGRQAVFVLPVIHHGVDNQVFGNSFIAHIRTGKVDEALLIVYKKLIKSI